MLSVIVPARGAAATLGRALASVPFADEVVVADTDGTHAVDKRDSPLCLRVVDVPGASAAAARNAAVAVARGDRLAFLDADDEWLALPDARGDVVHGVTEIVSGDRVEHARLWSAGGLLVTRSAFVPFDETLDAGEDLDWLLRARERDVAVVPVDDVVYRYHRTSRAGDRGVLAAARQAVLRARA